MNKSGKMPASSHQPFPRERGVPIPTHRHDIKLQDGSIVKAVGMDLSQALCPDRSYPADLAGVVYENGTVKLLFGQAARNGAVRSLIEVSMSPHAVLQMLHTIEALKDPSIEELVSLTGEESRTLSEFNEDPPEVARLKASMAALAFSGSEACVDFYDASPFTMGSVRNSNAPSANVMGVVRIDTQTALIHALVLRIGELVLEFPSKIRAFTGDTK